MSTIQNDLAETSIQARQDITLKEKQQLVMARRGQGLYRTRLEQIERACRVTGVSNRNYLRASHLKPWRDSTDTEKLDGNNGLLLSPHVDHLVDRGFISFTDEGQILVSSKLDTSVLESWGIDTKINVGSFNPEQQKYLGFHREHVFFGQILS